jgi:outer membrane lipoprotein-sorting protein
MRVLRFGIVLSLVSLLLAACGTQLTAEQIMDRMEQARANLQTAHVVADVAITSPEENGTVQVEGWAEKTEQTDANGQPVSRLRANVLQASEADLVGTQFVSDGSTFWLYNPSKNTVLTGSQSDLKRDDLGGQDSTMQMLQMQEMLQRLLDGSDVTVESQDEQVAGRTTWKVKLQPKAETQEELQLGSLITTYLWIDQATDLPVKARLEAGSQGTVEATATTLDLNQPIDAAQFQFMPPAGAEVVNVADLAEQLEPESTTLEGAKTQASFPVLQPAALPDGVQLQDVQVMQMRGETVLQFYGGTANFTIVQSQGDAPGEQAAPAGADVQEVTVRGQQAELITASGAEGGTVLRWSEDGISFVIAGTLSADQATALAESLQ